MTAASDARFTLDDAQRAGDEWGANCQPKANGGWHITHAIEVLR